jgi:glycine/D-amino acid oxidase-like deaminating enzyme
MTGNSLPRFHRLARNTVSISGYNGRGIAPGTSFGRDLGALACGGMTDEELSLPLSDVLAAPDFARPREAYYEVGSQVAHALGARLPRLGA